MIETRIASTCVTQHLKTFWEQDMSGKQADFGEPCESCPLFNECAQRGFQWLSNMQPVLKESIVKFSVCQKNLPGS